MRSSHNTMPPFANQLINNLIQAAEICDPVLINEFFALAIDSNIEHLNLIDDTLSLDQLIHRQRVIHQGTLLLALFNHFATREIKNGGSQIGIPSA
jgi:hypothetical protein